jgi:hypothetical protein
MLLIKEEKFKIDKIKIHQTETQIKKMIYRTIIAVKHKKKIKKVILEMEY